MGLNRDTGYLRGIKTIQALALGNSKPSDMGINTGRKTPRSSLNGADRYNHPLYFYPGNTKAQGNAQE